MEAAASRNRGGGAWRVAVLVAAGLGIYSPAWRGGWIWDDTLEVLENTVIRGPAKGLLGVWFAPAQADYFPLKTTVQWAEWHLWGDRPPGYHLTSVGLHVLSACLVWRVLQRMGMRRGWAWWGGLLFLVHPLAVESVAWIAELKNTLSLPLMLLAWDAHLTACAGEGGRLRSLGWFTAAMLAKTSVVMFPVCLLLHAWWRRRKAGGPDGPILSSLPFFAVSAILGTVTVAFQEHRAIGGRMGSDVIGSWGFRVVAAGGHLLFYFGKFLWPASPLPLYPRPPAGLVGFDQLWPWLVLGGVAALVACFCRGALDNCGRTAVFGLGWFVLNLLPVLGIIPMSLMNYTWVSDHFMYVPMLGLVGVAAAGAEALQGRLGRTSRPWPGAGGAWLAAGGACVLVVLAELSWRQAACYRDAASFWRLVTRKNPAAWSAHFDLAVALEGRPDEQPEAIAEYEKALRLRPESVGAQNNLANLLSRLPGREAEAEAHYRTVLRLKPDYAEAENNLANLIASQPGRQAEAESHYAQALRLRPGFAQARVNLANLLCREGGRDAEAEAHYRSALQSKPDDAEAHGGLALLLSREPGRQAEAIEEYADALRLKPDDAQAHNNLAILLADQPGCRAEAEALYRVALRLKPDYAEAHNNLGLLLAGDPKREAESLAQYETALRLEPKFAEAHANLALELVGDPRRTAEALAHYDTALALEPGNPAVQNNFANLLATIPGREQDAVAHYKAALRLRPDYADAHNNLANVLLKDPARLEEAVNHYETALRLRPDFAEAHFNLGVALANLGRRDEAARQFRLTLALRPDFAPARDNLERLHAAGIGDR